MRRCFRSGKGPPTSWCSTRCAWRARKAATRSYSRESGGNFRARRRRSAQLSRPSMCEGRAGGWIAWRARSSGRCSQRSGRTRRSSGCDRLRDSLEARMRPGHLSALFAMVFLTLSSAAFAQSADLSVTKADSPDPVNAGSNITYTITLSNAGPDPASVVSLTDTTPANTTFVSVMQTSGPGSSITSPAVGGTGTITANIVTLAAGATATFSLVVNVNAATPNGSTITNTATVSSTTTDPTPGNNSATATTTVNNAADLSVTKTDTPDPVNAGANITYTLTLTNNGPSPAQSVSLTDSTPANTTFVSVMQTSGPGSSITSPAVGGTGTITANIVTLAAGATATYTLVVNVNAAATGTISNTASVTSTTADPNAANNSATATTTINGADLAIAKSAGAGPFVAGGNVNYTITVTNNGPLTATGVTVVDTLPAGSTFVSSTPSQGSCTGTSTVTCNLGTLANGGTATIALVITASATPGMLSNTATVSSAVSDPNPANNTATSTVTTFVVIPTLSEWMLLLLALSLGGVGFLLMRSR